MALICIFHDRSEINHARSIVAVVSAAGHKAWLTDTDSVGDWRKDVQAALSRPECVGAIVVWSPDSIKNPIVVEEAELCLHLGRRILGVVIKGVELPLGLRWTPRVVADSWDGTAQSIDQLPLRQKMMRLTQPESETSRISEVVLNGKKLRCPAFVFSVSSFETQISPAKTLELLDLFTPPAVLVSAFDVLGTRDASHDVTPDDNLLKKLGNRDTVIFLDSGNYEAYRFENEWWQRSPWLLKEAISRLRTDVVFSHDRIVDLATKNDVRPDKIVSDLLLDLERDEKSYQGRPISPIIHAPRLEDQTFYSAILPKLCADIAKSKKPPLIAVAERELGDGILERARRVRSIRSALDSNGFDQPLHILGTGNPISMLILSFAGGNVFDGLEWCRTVVDSATMRLNHFHHYDLFVAQRSEIQDALLREYLTNNEELLTAKAKAVLHNLYFFKQFVEEIQQAHQNRAYEELFDKYLPGEFTRISRRIDLEDPR